MKLCSGQSCKINVLLLAVVPLTSEHASITYRTHKYSYLLLFLSRIFIQNHFNLMILHFIMYYACVNLATIKTCAKLKIPWL